MEPHENSGKWLFIAHGICCGGVLLVILLAGNAALLLSLARSGVFWIGIASLLGSVGFFIVRRRRACRTRLPTAQPDLPRFGGPPTSQQNSGQAALRPVGD